MRELKINRTITGRDLDSINKYMAEIAKIPLLTVEEEVRLARLVKIGDQNALEKLVRTNLRFVVSVAKNYQNRGLSLGDLINEGNLGLIKAAERFDESKGFKFISFAVWWIRQSIMLALAEQTRIVRLPMSVINAISRLNKVFSLLEQQLERIPTTLEVAAEIETEEQRVLDFLDSAHQCLSLDAVINYDAGATLLDIVMDNNPLPDHVLKIASHEDDVGGILKFLAPREQMIIRLYFGLAGEEPLSLENIAMIYKLSRERVRQLKDNGLKKLRLKALDKKLHTIYTA